MGKKYSIGLDFGTLAARAVLVDIETGKEEAVSVFEYRDAVIESFLPGTDIELPKDYALQNPKDYIEAVPTLLKDILAVSGVNAEDIIGIGVDATATTVIALDENYEPLCFQEKFRDDPHSWIKLWKHHGAQPQADRFNHSARTCNAAFLKRCGGKVSAEWFFPKLIETFEKSPEVFNAASCFLELGDWIVYLLTGNICKSSALAAIHAGWNEEDGYPENAIFERIAPGIVPGIDRNREIPIVPVFSKAGNLSESMAEMTGLPVSTPVSAAASDSPIALLSMGVADECTAVLILGTSSVLMALSMEESCIPGAMSCVKNQMMPRFVGNMFGQSAVGDVFGWFTDNMLPHEYYLKAEKNGETVFQLIDRYVSRLKPDDKNVMALGWLNGSRCLQNSELSGLLVGLKLSTKPEEIYLAFIESIAFELKKMINSMNASGMNIGSVRACGGISRKSPVIMQILADVLQLPVYTTQSKETVGHGAAIMGAAAADSEPDAYKRVCKYVSSMKCGVSACYRPDPDRREVYERRFEKYLQLYSYFGEENTGIMCN